MQNKMRICGRYKFYVHSGAIFTTVVSMILSFQSCKKLEIERIVIFGTCEVSDVTTNSASIKEILLDISEGGITQHGHCWSTTENPSVETDTKTNFGNRDITGSFTSEIGGLHHTTTYFVRAYAVSEGKTTYGNMNSFTTNEASPPEVTTATLSDISTNTVTCEGNIVSEGGVEITARGVCWSTDPEPDLSDLHTTDVSGMGSFSVILTGLTPATTYYVRAYATNEAGTSYGNQVEFKTFGVMDYDGNGYYSVVIGAQEWMQQNLKTTHYADGTLLIDGANAGDIYGDCTTKFCFINNNDESNLEIYGRLYTWAAAMNGSNSSSSIPSGVQGVCPAGWHLPSDDEWKQLEMFLGMSQVEADIKGDRGTNEGGKLKSLAYFWSPNTGATNESGFSAVPGADRIPDGSYNPIGSFATFWTTTEYDATSSYHRSVSWNNSLINRWNNSKYYGFSVRCIKD